MSGACHGDFRPVYGMYKIVRYNPHYGKIKPDGTPEAEFIFQEVQYEKHSICMYCDKTIEGCGVDRF